MPASPAARCLRLILLVPPLAMAGLVDPVRGEAVDFDRDVAPILVRRCLECHGPGQAFGGLVLAGRDEALAGGDDGAVIVAGAPEASRLIRRVSAGEMPPEQQGRSQRLPDAEVETLRQWVAAGAPWPAARTLDLYEQTSDVRAGRDWWSLQAVRRPAVPATRHPERVANPIDAFILARLEAEEMEPAPPADRRTLIRRASYVLTGLPPAFEEIEAFAADGSEEAWERLVDRLLAAPHYGERWARHWLDVVRYADTSGYERDQEKIGAWKYRDWVVEALNADLPYDRFVLEQLAGDELPDRSERTVIATGFLRLGTWNDEPNDPEDYQYERLEDLVHATSTAFLGLTVKCARCHDHKFDPVPQEDYYRMAAAFQAGPIEPRARELLGGPTPEELGYADVLGWTDVTATPPPLYLLKNGDRHQPQQIVEPGPLTLAPALFEPFAPAPEGARTTSRRLQLARWIVRPDNPLTARVLVNRLWQHHFGHGLVRSPDNFGFTGDPPTHPELLDWLASELVRGGWRLKPLHRLILTSNTWRQASVHPELDDYQNRDFANRLWWRAERRRLDAEALRDALLAVSGEIDLRPGGPGFRPAISAEALEGLSRKSAAWQASPPEEQLRRSLYIFTQRSLLPPMLTTFDFADTTLPCGQRDVTTVAPQALALLNDPFSHARSTALAQRALSAAGDEPQARMEAAWRFALGRVPEPDEARAAAEHLHDQRQRFEALAANAETSGTLPLNPELLALVSLCQVLLNSNEFVYVD